MRPRGAWETITGWLSAVVLLGLAEAMPHTAAAESRLPPCRGDNSTYWTNCWGTYTFPDGAKYVGEWKDNKRNGQGTYTLPDGRKYVGEWKDDKRNGLGTKTYPSGTKYVGEFKDGKYNGQGTKTYSFGSKYVGEFKDGEYNGQGTYTYANGTKYVGEFKDGKYNGQGTITYSFGSKYVGEFKDGEYNGQGTYTFPTGTKHVGEFRDGNFNGQGTLTLPNGEKYVGEFKDGKQSGQGTLFSPSGQIIQNGIWLNGDFVQANNLPNPMLTAQRPAHSDSSVNTSSRTAPVATSPGAAIRLIKEGGTFKVPVRINDVIDLHFTVDSGAADVSIPADVVLTLVRTGTVGENDFIGEQTYRLADGSTVKSKTFRLHQLKVGDRTINNVLGSIADINGSLLLGQSFLSRFRSVKFDYAQGVLVLE